MHLARWLAVVPIALGAILTFFGVIWLAWPQLVWGPLLVGVGAAWWRAPTRAATRSSRPIPAPTRRSKPGPRR